MLGIAGDPSQQPSFSFLFLGLPLLSVSFFTGAGIIMCLGLRTECVLLSSIKRAEVLHNWPY